MVQQDDDENTDECPGEHFCRIDVDSGKGERIADSRICAEQLCHDRDADGRASRKRDRSENRHGKSGQNDVSQRVPRSAFVDRRHFQQLAVDIAPAVRRIQVNAGENEHRDDKHGNHRACAEPDHRQDDDDDRRNPHEHRLNRAHRIVQDGRTSCDKPAANRDYHSAKKSDKHAGSGLE